MFYLNTTNGSFKFHSQEIATRAFNNSKARNEKPTLFKNNTVIA